MNLDIPYFRKGNYGISGHGNTPVALAGVPLAGCLEGRLQDIFYSNQQVSLKDN